MDPINSLPKLTMVITELDIGGAEKAFVQIAKGLSLHGWDVDAVSLRDAGPLTEELRSAGIQVGALGCGGFADFRSVIRLRRLLKQHSPDVLLTFLHQANIAGRLAGWLAGVPVIVSGVRVADRRAAVWLPERFTSGCVDHYICNSQQTARVHAALCKIDAEKFSTILNGVDLESIRKTPAIPRDNLNFSAADFLFVFVGRLTDQKAPNDLVAAFARLPNELQQSSGILVVGDGPLLPSLKSQIESSGLQNRIKLSGWRPDAIAFIKAADCLVLPSRWEGMPNVVMEALAIGRRVIAADVDGVRELITDESMGMLFPSGSICDLARLLEAEIRANRTVSSPPQESQAFTFNALTWDSVVRQYHQTLHQLLTLKQPTRFFKT